MGPTLFSLLDKLRRGLSDRRMLKTAKDPDVQDLADELWHRCMELQFRLDCETGEPDYRNDVDPRPTCIVWANTG